MTANHSQQLAVIGCHSLGIHIPYWQYGMAAPPQARLARRGLLLAREVDEAEGHEEGSQDDQQDNQPLPGPGPPFSVVKRGLVTFYTREIWTKTAAAGVSFIWPGTAVFSG